MQGPKAPDIIQAAVSIKELVRKQLLPDANWEHHLSASPSVRVFVCVCACVHALRTAKYFDFILEHDHGKIQAAKL